MHSILELLAQETAENRYVHWAHIVTRETVVYGTFVSMRGTVQRDTRFVIAPGTRLNVYIIGKDRVSGHIPCYSGHMTVELPTEIIARKEKD